MPHRRGPRRSAQARATLVFRVTGGAVVILRVFHGGQDFERALRGEPED